ncbi:uncharacterized protein EI90DRAFT_3122472 [Cantharellus anzutake]|uniref:uncharacterized protein n=1 Tax=Cantharellus anzutake TaxID=1750568 RepID=UPI0019087326|nr:uncharacterized protein EI90DRAFT_3122472 [Cantharellus anzutake]KAF8332738.1 hypothetical protein EI90DRAFT_3122472 [Cantharellus anzutake]
MLKRNQQKGFDFLSPSGFHNAVRAYGLPDDIIQLDTSAQNNVRCVIWTAYGDTTPIVINGVTKQGGPLSPLKSALTTSLGHHWISETAGVDIASLRSRALDPHLPSDSLNIRLTMVEATNDSLLFAPSLPVLQEICLKMEKFQAAYGWLTAWNKSEVVILNSSQPIPNSVSLPSINPTDPLSDNIQFHDVPTCTDHINFLKVPINDPTSHFKFLSSLISNFKFPKCNPPITVLRKIINQVLISKIRAHLSLHQVSPTSANSLQSQISLLLHSQLPFPFPPSLDIVCLLTSNFGLGITSIRHLNKSLALCGLLRDLNHHIPVFRKMALISMADWQCAYCHCIFPLSSAGLSYNFASHHCSLPFHFTLAQRTLKDLGLQVHPSDQSYLVSGNVSLSHIANLAPSAPHSSILHVYCSTPFAWLSSWGVWRYSGLSSLPHVFLPNVPNPFRQFDPQNYNFTTVTAWLSSLNLWHLSIGPSEFTVPQDERQVSAEECICAAARTFGQQSLMEFSSDNCWATDGSALHGLYPSISCAVVGPLSLSLRIAGCDGSSLHGEVMALIMVAVLSHPTPTAVVVFSDHLHLICLIQDIRAGTLPPNFWSYKPARPWYRWLEQIVANNQNFSIYHVKAHTQELDVTLRLNNAADHLAAQAHFNLLQSPLAPLPSFSMDDFVAWHPGCGYVDSNLLSYFSSRFVSMSHHALGTLTVAKTTRKDTQEFRKLRLSQELLTQTFVTLLSTV